MDSKPGTYVLVLYCDTSISAQIGRWGLLDVRPGYYIYVGSAFGPGGVLARVARHCREIKSKHWHIDYLREYASIRAVWYRHSSMRLEHRWAAALAELKGLKPVRGFGCSDCKCESHLFYTAMKPKLVGFTNAVGGTVKSWSCERSG